VTTPDQVTGAAREETSAVAGTAAEESKAVAGTAKEQAGAVASTTAQAAGDVKDTAVEQASAVASETKQQVGNVVSQFRDQLSSQSQAQTQRAAGGLRALADQLHGLASGQPPQSGAVVDFVRGLGERVQQFAGQLESQGPQGLLDQTRSFSRRRPGGFLAGAALVGVAAGRLVKAATAGGSSNGGPSTGYSPPTPTYADTTYPTDTTYPSSGSLGTTTYDYGTDYAADYGTVGGGAPLSGVQSDSDLYVDRVDEATYSPTYIEPEGTGAGYETDPYRRGTTGSDPGRI